MPERLTVVMPARNETESFQKGFIQEVFDNIPDTYEPTIVVAVGDSNPEFIGLTNDMQRENPNLKVLQLGTGRPNMLAYAYLQGLRHAIGDGADKAVEMDASGAHNPIYIPEFARALGDHDAAFSSRFSEGSGIDRYPLQRKIISYGGTKVAKAYLGLKGDYPDLTSGYEAFRREVLSDVFDVWNPENWISVTEGPGHFYQLEMRTYVIWRGHDVGIVPIVWGTNRAKDPTPLPARTAIKALTNLYTLRKRRNNIIK